MTALLLLLGAGCLVAGTFLLWGVGVMLLVIGALLLAGALVDFPEPRRAPEPVVTRRMDDEEVW